MTSFEQFRTHFPIFERRVYVNSCSQGALSTEVEAAVREYLTSWNHEGSPWERWVDTCEQLRAEFAALVGAETDEMAIMPSASCALGAIATSLSFDERPEVALGPFEFPTATHAWLAQRPRGATIRWVEREGTDLSTEDYAAVVSDRTRIVPVTHVCFRNGHRLDVARIAAMCRERGALCLLDDYQSTGTQAIDVKALGVDMMVTGALKYLLGPSGVAFLYVRRDLIEQLEPLVTGWFGRTQPFAFDIARLDWAPSARRFEAGSPPVVNAYAALAGIRLLRTLDAGGEPQAALARVERHIATLVARFMRGCEDRGHRVSTPSDPSRRGALVVVEASDAPALVSHLATRDIVASARGNGVRVSFHAYNTEADVDHALAALEVGDRG